MTRVLEKRIAARSLASPKSRTWLGTGAGIWLAAIALVVWGAGSGDFPLHDPAARWSVSERLGAAHIVAAEVAVLIGVVWWVTRRSRPDTGDLIAEGPTRDVARRELGWAAAYLVIAQLSGAFLGRALGVGALSYHLHGSVHGTHHHLDPASVAAWAGYNLLVYVLVPSCFLVRRYGTDRLWLRTTDRRRDVTVTGVVLGLDSVFQLLVFGAAYFALSGTQLVGGTLLSFSISFLGTVLPTLVVVAVLVVPRVLVLTGSQIAATVSGGAVYAALHLFDGWTDYSTLELAALSIGLLVLQYFVPGCFKAVLTLRTGNAWVHAWAYHAIGPHVWADTPLIVRVFGLR